MNKIEAKEERQKDAMQKKTRWEKLKDKFSEKTKKALLVGLGWLAVNFSACGDGETIFVAPEHIADVTIIEDIKIRYPDHNNANEEKTDASNENDVKDTGGVKDEIGGDKEEIKDIDSIEEAGTVDNNVDVKDVNEEKDSGQIDAEQPDSGQNDVYEQKDVTNDSVVDIGIDVNDANEVADNQTEDTTGLGISDVSDGYKDAGQTDSGSIENDGGSIDNEIEYNDNKCIIATVGLTQYLVDNPDNVYACTSAKYTGLKIQNPANEYNLVDGSKVTAYVDESGETPFAVLVNNTKQRYEIKFGDNCADIGINRKLKIGYEYYSIDNLAFLSTVKLKVRLEKRDDNGWWREFEKEQLIRENSDFEMTIQDKIIRGRVNSIEKRIRSPDKEEVYCANIEVEEIFDITKNEAIKIDDMVRDGWRNFCVYQTEEGHGVVIGENEWLFFVLSPSKFYIDVEKDPNNKCNNQ